MQTEASEQKEGVLSALLTSVVFDCNTLGNGIARLLSLKLGNAQVRVEALEEVFHSFFASSSRVIESIAADICSIHKRDPAAEGYLTPFLFFKGFQAVQTHRVAHWLWEDNRKSLARYLQGRSSEIFAVDIHPGARIGQRVMFDHGTGIVVGETAVIEDDVALLQNVTLGGTGKESGDRHPKVRRGALIGTGAKVLGNIEIGEGAKVGAGAIVLHPVPPFTTVVGNPARVVGKPHADLPSLTMDQTLPSLNYVI